MFLNDANLEENQTVFLIFLMLTQTIILHIDYIFDFYIQLYINIYF